MFTKIWWPMSLNCTLKKCPKKSDSYGCEHINRNWKTKQKKLANPSVKRLKSILVELKKYINYILLEVSHTHQWPLVRLYLIINKFMRRFIHDRLISYTTEITEVEIDFRVVYTNTRGTGNYETWRHRLGKGNTLHPFWCSKNLTCHTGFPFKIN